ncbi:helix-turn-helix transcriptional regulator [Belnapia sp. T6]|uniref:Helix-turn-helix transcriptional regulator n=1 Tax=Belnapia mucosa TaxID=2804532 RepID=A0ABS1V5W1_9PROT|nr:AraC family transcriptional regulator [Belnapia mucosa]MBL6457068.1 helix-turn-helix transcriptional regulator [Belnapia mucosa]
MLLADPPSFLLDPWEGAGLAAEPRLYRLAKVTGPFPAMLDRMSHLIFLPTAAGGRLLGLPRTGALLPGEAVLLFGPHAATPHWQAVTGVLAVIGDQALRAMLERLGGTLPEGEPLRSRDPLLTQLLLAMAEAAERGGGAVLPAFAAALLARMAELVQARLPLPSNDTGALAAWRLRRVETFVAENLGRPIRLAELAEAAGLSVFHFSRAFKRSTGLAPQAWLMRRRLARAQELLADGATSLIDAAFEAGFCSHAHLTSSFRRVLGTTPSAWRAHALDRRAAGQPARAAEAG